MSNPRDIIGKPRLLSEEDLSFCQAVARGRGPHSKTVKRLLEDRQARKEREEKVSKLVAEANLYMIDAKPDASEKAEELISEVLDLLAA